MSALLPSSFSFHPSPFRRTATPSHTQSPSTSFNARAQDTDPESSNLLPLKYPAYLENTHYAQIINQHHAKRRYKRVKHLSGTNTIDVDWELDPIDLRLPSKLNVKDKSRYIEVIDNGYTLAYTGPAKNEIQAASARSNWPMKPQCGIYYYEMTVINKGEDGYIGIGFCSATSNLERLPGWEADSWGYHGDDGHSFAGSASGKNYGPRFTTGDVVGCGVNFADQTAFYTKNGTYLGTAFKAVKTSIPLYPCIGMRTVGEKVSVNFGKDPFVFNISQYVKDQQLKMYATIAARPITPNDDKAEEQKTCVELILAYLVHHGYVGTAQTVARHVRSMEQHLMGEQKASGDLQLDDSDIRNRQYIRSAVLAGDIDVAISLTKQYFPKVFEGEAGKRMLFELHCFKFVEMVRNNNKRIATHQHTAISDMSLDGDDANGTSHRQEPCSLSQASITHLHNDEHFMDVDEHEDDKCDSLHQIMTYGRWLQKEYGQEENSSYQQRLKEIFSLMAYSDIEHCPVGYLMQISARDALATDLNKAIMVYLQKPETSSLECIMSQVMTAQSELLVEGNGQSALMNVKELCLPSNVTSRI